MATTMCSTPVSSQGSTPSRFRMPSDPPTPTVTYTSLSRAFQRRLSMDSQVVNGGGGSPQLERRLSQPQGDREKDQMELMYELQEQALLPLKEDLADWIGTTLGIDISIDNFYDTLDNGVYLCQLVRLIQGRALDLRQEGYTEMPEIPTTRIKCKESARSGTWFARDNIANFLQWCRNCGVKEEYMFETEELVCHRQRKNILLCVMDIARLGSRFGIEPPGLVTLEKEIEREEAEVFKVPNIPDKKPLTNGSGKHRNDSDSVSLNGSSEFGSDGDRSLTPRQRTPTKIPGPQRGSRTPTPTRAPTPTRIPTPTQSPRRPSSTGKRRRSSSSTSSTASRPEDLDQKVMRISGACRCPSCYQVERLAEGRYMLGGKVVFVRLLKGRHVMVRVGGGWDTLDHYIATHDPCKVVEIRRTTSSMSLVDGNNVQDRYLHMQGRYRSQSSVGGKS